MLVIIVSWLVWFPIYSGIGLLLRRYHGLRTGGGEALLLSFWIGWSCTIFLLQIWHLWFRVDQSVQLLAAIAGVCGLIWNRALIWGVITYALRARKGALVLLLVLGLWLANRTNGPVGNYDTALYYLGSTEWNNAYPIVPGLGNLHERLAFNSSFFLFAAMLNTGLWNQQAYVIANGLLWFGLMLQIVFYLSKLIYEHSKNIVHLFYGLLLGMLLTQAFGGYSPQSPALIYNISSLSPDIPVLILGVIVSGLVLSLLLDLDRGEIDQYYRLVCIALLAGVGIAVKLSFLSFGLSALGIAFIVWFVRNGQRSITDRVRLLSIIALYPSALLLPWMLRGFILSGYPVFPSPIGGIDVDWRMPRALAIIITNMIRSWARQPRVPWFIVLGNDDWLRPWLYRFLQQKSVHLAVVALVLAVACTRLSIDQSGRARLRWLFLLPAALSVVFWFIAAPDMRFAGASFWVLAAGLTAIAAERIVGAAAHSGNAVRWLPLGLCVVYMLYVIPFRIPVWNPPYQPSADGLYPLPQIPYRSLTTKSGLVINLPETGDQCWVIPLPCTPYPRRNLRLRDGSNISSGFRLDRPSEFVDTFWTDLPAGFSASNNIAVTLSGGWHEFEPKNNLRWMHNPGRVTVYVDQETIARFSLQPFMMNVNQSFGTSGQLKIMLNGELIVLLPVQTRVTNDILLYFQPGFNIIEMELMAGDFVPAQADRNSNDERPLSISFYPIKIMSLRSGDKP